MASVWKRELGVEAGPYVREWKAHAEAMQQGAFQVGRGGWAADYADPVTFLELLRSGTPLNTSGWSDATYDALLDEAAATTDAASRMRLLARAERLMLDEAPILPLFHFTSFCLLKPYVGGYQVNALSIHLLKDLSLGTAGGPGFSRGD